MSEEKTDIRKTIATYLGIAYRGLAYWKWGILAAFIVAMGALGYAATRKKVWTSTTRIRVVPANVASNPIFEAAQLDRMHEELEGALKKFTGSRRFLQEVVDEFGLYGEMKARKGMTDAEVLDLMRGKMYWAVYEGDEFGFNFNDHDPRMAQAVCKSLAEHFIKQRSIHTRSASEEKLRRVVSQLEEVEGQLQQKESYLTRFNEIHSDFIKQIRMEEALGGAQPEPEPAGPTGETRIRRSDTPELVKARLRLKSLQETKARISSKSESSTNDRMTDLRSRKSRAVDAWTKAKASYDRMLQRVTAEHPDARRQKQNVSRLAAAKSAAVRDYESANRENRRPPAELSAIDGEIASTRDEITKLERVARRLAQKQKAPEEADSGPVVEEGDVKRLKTKEEVATKLKRLETELSPLRQAYQQLTERKLNLEFSVAQQREGSMQYVVIDPANLPTRPSGPARTKLALIGGAGGVGLGLAVMLILGFLDNRIYRPVDLSRLPDVPLLTAVTDFSDQMDGLPENVPPQRPGQHPPAAPG